MRSVERIKIENNLYEEGKRVSCDLANEKRDTEGVWLEDKDQVVKKRKFVKLDEKGPGLGDEETKNRLVQRIRENSLARERKSGEENENEPLSFFYGERGNERPLKKSNNCNSCHRSLRHVFVQCLKCKNKFHDSCSRKGSRIASNHKVVFICASCNICVECKLEADECMIRCQSCPQMFHSKCQSTPFCKTCREILYVTAHGETILKFESNNFCSLIRNKGFMKDQKDQMKGASEKIVDVLYIGKKKLSPQYLSPFCNVSFTMYICEMCFSYFKESISLERHKIKCKPKNHGNLVYSKENLQLYEVDGELDTIFCRNLCLIGKCFLDHKTLYYDVEPFLFYTLYQNGDFVGYFSREKFSLKLNLSCVVVLPCYQGQGFGYFLIDFSYRLFKLIGEKGTPEKPFSDQGLAVYKKYWRYKVYQYLSSTEESISIRKISDYLGMINSDVVFALELLEFLKKAGDKYYINVSPKIFIELKTCDPDCIIARNIILFKE